MILFLLFSHEIECSYSSVAPLSYSSACNASSSHNQTALCNNQRHLVPSVLKTTCSALYPPSSNLMCSNNCAAIKTTCSNRLMHHSSIPHSKSLDHYNEATSNLEHHNASRHSFDQTISTNYKNYDCVDGTNGYHYSGGAGVYHQPNCNLQNAGNRCPLPTIPFPDHHYSQIGGFDRGESFIETNIGPCCHQNPHYDYPTNFNGRSSQKPKNTDYSNCNFQTQ